VVEGLKEGVELTLRQFREVLDRHGVTLIESLGQAFDPKLHEAVARVERDDVPPGTVVTEFQRGYRFRDRLLRAAQVCVSVEPARAEPVNERADNL
jgi:molecular chaperone GrpE